MMKGYQFLKIILFISIFLLNNIGFAAEVTVKADRDQVSLGESFNLNIEWRGNANNPPFVDFSPLTKDFKILGTGQASQFSTINGKTFSLFRWVLTLTPLKTGKLIIPSLFLNNFKTNSIEITVNQGAVPQLTGSKKLLFLDVQVSPKNPYVESALLYTVKFYYRDDIKGFNNAYLSEPSVENATVKLNDDDRNYATTIEHTHYHVFERRYVISPRSSGLITINPVIAQGEIIKEGTSDDPFNMVANQGDQPFKLVGPVIKLNVLAKPADFKSSWWLPAKSLILTSTWEKSGSQTKIGEPIIRTVTLTAVGVTASQLPEIPKKLLSGTNSYSENTQLENTVLRNEVVGKRIEKIVYIPTTSGSVSIPDIHIAWWNIDKNRQEITTLAGQKFMVTENASLNHSSDSQINSNQSPLKILPPVTSTKLSDKVLSKSKERFFFSIWFWFSLILFLLWLFTLLIWIKPWRYFNFVNQGSREKYRNKKSRMTEIKKASLANDAYATKNAIIAWMQQQGFSCKHLDEAIALVDSEALKVALKILRENLYSKKKINWDGTLFWEIFSKNHEIKPDPKDSIKKSNLPELYL